MVLLIVATVIGALTPSVIRQISHARVNRAANVVAADFFLAQSLAGRQHAPVIITFDYSGKLVLINQPPPSGTMLITRHYGMDSEFKISAFSATSLSVQVLPNGMVNTSVTLTIGDGTYSRQIKITRAGQVRVL